VGVGLGVWVSNRHIPVATRLPSGYQDVFPLEGEELSHRIIPQSRLQLNYERNHQVAPSSERNSVQFLNDQCVSAPKTDAV
jgi:hypothetical protein